MVFYRRTYIFLFLGSYVFCRMVVWHQFKKRINKKRRKINKTHKIHVKKRKCAEQHHLEWIESFGNLVLFLFFFFSYGFDFEIIHADKCLFLVHHSIIYYIRQIFPWNNPTTRKFSWSAIVHTHSQHRRTKGIFYQHLHLLFCIID